MPKVPQDRHYCSDCGRVMKEIQLFTTTTHYCEHCEKAQKEWDDLFGQIDKAAPATVSEDTIDLGLNVDDWLIVKNSVAIDNEAESCDSISETEKTDGCKCREDYECSYHYFKRMKQLAKDAPVS